MKQLSKLKKGDKVAIVSPSFVPPESLAHVYELGYRRLGEIFELEPVEMPNSRKPQATEQDKMGDLIRAFSDPEIKAVLATIGGNHQVTYVKNLPPEPFQDNPKPFLGYSDNTHLANYLWLQGIPSYYGACLFIQLGTPGAMDELTVKYLKRALFETGEFELEAGEVFSDEYQDWNKPENLEQPLKFESNEGWYWDGELDSEGVSWGGCLESLDELLRHRIEIPSLEEFQKIILLTETSEEMPSGEYVARVYRALGELGILERVQGVLVGRPQAWNHEQPLKAEAKRKYKQEQREAILEVVRKYNPTAPVVQNLDFGHTLPQIPIPYGRKITVSSTKKKIRAKF